MRVRACVRACVRVRACVSAQRRHSVNGFLATLVPDLSRLCCVVPPDGCVRAYARARVRAYTAGWLLLRSRGLIS